MAVGEEPVEAVARARDARVLLLAADAAEGTRRRCEHFAQAGDCLWLQLPFTKAELGRALGRTAVAITAVTDVGLAAALLHRLAELDPEQYADAADRMDVKARRAAERRAEQAAHEKNLRQGKRRRKAPPTPKAAKPPAETPPERAPDGNRPRGAKPYPQGRSPQAEGTGAAIRQQPPGEKGQRLLPQEKGRLTDRAAAACVRGSYLKKFPSPRVGAERGVSIGY